MSTRSTSRSTLLASRARLMRFAPTESERLLWRELRGGRLGVVFRRQVPILGVIVDFAAPAVRLVVEVDGGYHAWRREADQRRDSRLGRAGWRVVRVEAERVVQTLGGVVAEIVAAVRSAAG